MNRFFLKALSGGSRTQGSNAAVSVGVARARHRDPMLREFLGILRWGSPTMIKEIGAWMARREPLRQPVV